MTRAYDQADDASTDMPPARWRLALLAFVALVVGGVVLVMAVIGMANLPCNQAAVIPPNSSNSVSQYPTVNLYYYGNVQRLPFTFEITAQNLSDDNTLWGIWVGSEVDYLFANIRDDGYFSISQNSSGEGWQEFYHIRRDSNSLCLFIDETETATFYINNEIAWNGQLSSVSGQNWGYLSQVEADIRIQQVSISPPN